MTGRSPRALTLAAALFALLALAPAVPVHAATGDASTHVGWARVARVVWRKVQPWVLTLADLLFDQPGGSTAPPPPPEPIEPPPVPDPDYTP